MDVSWSGVIADTRLFRTLASVRKNLSNENGRIYLVSVSQSLGQNSALILELSDGCID